RPRLPGCCFLAVASALRLLLEVDQDLDGLALVHRAVAVRHLVEADDSVEDTAWLDPPVEDVRHELLDVCARRGRTAGDADVVEEGRRRRRNLLLLGNADSPDRAAGTRDAESRDRRLLVANALEDG